MSYVILVEGVLSNDGAYASFWYGGDDLGTGIQGSISHCTEAILMDEAWASMVSDGSDEQPAETLPTETSELWRIGPVHTWNRQTDQEQRFRFPDGVVPADHVKGVDPSTIREGYTIAVLPEYHRLIAVVDRRRLCQVLTGLFERLPSRDGFEIDLLDHWGDSDATEIWIGHPKYRDGAILDYLFANTINLVENGGVELAFYSRQEHCTLRLTDHKILELYSPTAEYLAHAEQELISRGFHRSESLPKVDHLCEHYHYTSPLALDRVALARQLHADQFRMVET